MDVFYYILTAISAFVLGLFIKSFFPAYFNEKGRNLAIKEDGKEITQIVEQVKTELSKDLEFVKLELTKRAAIHKLVAEKEITAMSEIGNILFDLRISTVSLRPIADHLPTEIEEKKQAFQKRFDNWAEKHNLFLNTVEKHRLFLPKHIYEFFMMIRKLAAKEGLSFDAKIRYGNGEFNYEDYLNATENIENLIKAIDMTAQMIHQRYEIEGLDISPVPLNKNLQ